MSNLAKALAAMVLLGGWSITVHAGENEGGDDEHGGGRSHHQGGSGGRGHHQRLADDVNLRMTLAHRTGASPEARISVRNRGTNDQSNVLLQVFSDSTGGALLWSTTVSLAKGRSADFRTTIAPAADVLAVVATATLSGAVDAFPSDNTVSVPLGRGGQSGDASLGASLYSTNCASCHGADARGTASGPWIRGRSAGDVNEAIHEGEDGMPTFPFLSWEDARRIAVFLQNPDAVTPPPPPPTTPPPPPGSAAPTYSGSVKALLDSRCVGCHDNRSPGSGLRFDSYATASSNASSGLAAVKAGRMPKGGTLTAAEVKLLQDWVTGGTPK